MGLKAPLRRYTKAYRHHENKGHENLGKIYQSYRSSSRGLCRFKKNMVNELFQLLFHDTFDIITLFS
jgi:hypothetical protein